MQADDALLAIDWNADGIINDNSELFGSGTVDGFAILSALDSNSDGVINNLDTDFSNLLLWQDLNQDGISNADELTALSDIVLSIDLAGVTEVDYDIEGNPISHESTFNFVGGGTGEIVDAWFAHDNVNTRYRQDYDLDMQSLFGSTVRGYGMLPDLHISMSLDTDLRDMVYNLAIRPFNELFVGDGTVKNEVTNILYKWAGVENLATDSRGGFISDARMLEFQEALLGQDYLQRGYYSNPFQEASVALEENFDSIVDHYMAKLLTQTAAGDLFEGTPQYDLVTDSFTGITGINADALDDLETLAGNATTSLDVWKSVVTVIENVYGTSNLSTSDFNALNDAIQTTDPSETIGTIISETSSLFAYNEITGTSSSETIDGTSSNDDINGASGGDTLNGFGGHDILDSGSTIANEQDTLIGGTGNDTLYGGGGSDIYQYNFGDGSDTIIDFSGSNDTILFGAGITFGDLTITRISYTDIHIEIDGSGDIFIENQLAHNSVLDYTVETLEFSDTSTFDLRSLSFETHGTAEDDLLQGIEFGIYDKDDVLYGYAGGDTIKGQNGNDTLYGGAGDDILEGGDGDDTYVFESGHDVINRDHDGADELSFATHNQTDITFTRQGKDLLLEIDSENSIFIKDQFNGYPIETLRFADTTTFDMSTLSSVITGTASNDSLYGTTSGGSIHDIMYGLGGNDTLRGYDGDDVLYGGDGDDNLQGYDDNDYLAGGQGDDILRGGNGDDTYFYDYGHDVIEEGGNGFDTVELSADYDINDISFIRYDYGLEDDDWAIIQFDAYNSLTIDEQFASPSYRIEAIRFSTGTTIDLAEQQFETHGTSGNDAMYGIVYGGSIDDIMYGFDGDDELDGANGNDFLAGGAGDDELEGKAGDDHYFYESGHDIILNENYGDDVLEFDSTYTIGDLTFIRYDASDDDDLHILIDGSNSIIIDEQFWNAAKAIETVRLSDNTEIDLLTQQFETHGTSGNDSIYGIEVGGSENDIIYGFGGNDVIYGYDGQDTLYGGDGADDLRGYDGDDILIGGVGADVLKGHAGADTFLFDDTTFTGKDTIIDFDLSEEDVLDFSHLVSGYDPLTDLIEDFISLSEASGDTTFAIDQDGTGTTYGFQDVVTVNDVTGMVLDDLINDGTVIV